MTKEEKRIYDNKRRENNKNNPEFKTKLLIRDYLRRILKKAKYEAGALNYLFKDIHSDKIEFIVGCTIKEFIFHIEDQFKSDMNWKNHGDVWHLDHEFPLSVCVELCSPEESLQLVNHYTNLQPLYVSENLSKSNKI